MASRPQALAASTSPGRAMRKPRGETPPVPALTPRPGISRRRATGPSPIHDVLDAPGRPLPPVVGRSMGDRFDHDFVGVRLHTGPDAARAASAVDAAAFTVGRDIVFGAGRYAPTTPGGRRLLHHELTHVVQQRRPVVPVGPELLARSQPSDPVEREARGLTPAGRRSEGVRPATPMLMRVGVGETLARLFGEGTFSEDELQDYLAFLDREDTTEGDYDSDNKARAVVRRWRRGDAGYLLPPRRKLLLIREMIDGFTGNPDERAILELLQSATDDELRTIVDRVGENALRDEIHGAERDAFDALMARRRPAEQPREEQGAGGDRDRERAGGGDRGTETFDPETILEVQRRFTSNAADVNRLNCILIVRELAPQLFAEDPELAARVSERLGGLSGGELKMTEVGRALADLGLVADSARIRFDNGNGTREPSAMQTSAWDTIMGMVGDVQGWHVFGLAVFDGYHSVTVLVENRPDGPRLYWADQWRIDRGDDFHEEEGSVSGFRRYEQAGFDRFLTEFTVSRWRSVLEQKGARYRTTLHIWKFRSGLERGTDRGGGG